LKLIIILKEKKKELEEEEFKLSDYDILETLGTGTFGRVRLCQNKNTKKILCFKIDEKRKNYKIKSS